MGPRCSLVTLLLAVALGFGCGAESTPPPGPADASGLDGASAGPDASEVLPLDGSTGPGADAARPVDADTQPPDAASPAGPDAGSRDAGPVGVDAATLAGDDAGTRDAGVPGDGGLDPFSPTGTLVSTWSGKLANGKGVKVFYPKGSLAEPLVVFAHGFQLGNGDYDDTLGHVASFGYVVASVDYPGSALGIDHHDVVVALQQAVDLLTTAPPAALAGRVDATRIAFAGHSLGGKAAVWGATVDSRVKACVSIDPVDDDQSPIGQDPVKHPSVTPELMGGLTVPTLFIAGEKSGSCAPAASNACRFDEAASQSVPHYLAVLKGFGHMQFVEASVCLLCLSCASGVSGAAETLARTSLRGLIVSFLQESLRADATWHTFLDGPGRQTLTTRGVILDDPAQAAFCTPPPSPDGGT